MSNQKAEKNTKHRAPIVVVLGHVDHGKSSLLEAIKEDFVITSKESGGITQHIGAYEIEKYGKKITFIDTPGHEAFSDMRQRGVNVADVALLVIDAVEGIKEQTKEAIKFIKQEKLPLIVVFNKMDKPGALPEKIKPKLADFDIIVESYGGKVPSVNVSAKEKTGIKELLETILLVSEIENLELDLDSPAQGFVLESALLAKKGVVATLIPQKGILKIGDIIGTKTAKGKIKKMLDFQGNPIQQAIPSQPTRLLGFENSPLVGDTFKVYNDKDIARQKMEKVVPNSPVNNDYNGEEQDKGVDGDEGEQDKKILNLILKTDVSGTCEAIKNILLNIPREKVSLRILKAETGDITTSDAQLAINSNALIFGFMVNAPQNVKLFARQRGVRIKTFSVIYELVQEVRQAMLRILSPKITRIDIGKFEITHIFKQNKDKQIIGGKVKEGEITLNSRAEIYRDEEIIGNGRIKTLQKDKQDIGKATKGQQVAMFFDSKQKVLIGDILTIFREEKGKDTL